MMIRLIMWLTGEETGETSPALLMLLESPTCTILQIITKLDFQGKFPAGGGEDHEPFHQSQRERDSVVSVQYT